MGAISVVESKRITPAVAYGVRKAACDGLYTIDA